MTAPRSDQFGAPGWDRDVTRCGTLTTAPDTCKLNSDLWYLLALVRGPGGSMRTLCLAVLATTALGATLASAGSAETVSELERQARALRSENAALAADSRSAQAGLAAIEARLAQTRAELASFRARAAVVHSRRRAVNAELRVARASLRSVRIALARRLQALYERGEPDALAIILGAGSLEGALDAVETMDLAARQDEDLLAQAQRATRRLARLNRALAGRERELEQLATARAAAAESLAAARAERLRTIAAMQSASTSNSNRIAGLEKQARTLSSTSAPAPTVVSGAPRISDGPASGGVHQLTVVATGYALSGTTASGRPVGWGAVAVDPSVIPLGSRLSVPGYGLGVASDTGGAIQGSRIDLWFPSVAEAHGWGSRVLTITVYSP
jgi:3D (Asp-Asp-Asp) domain-containing protein/peptidoglycan hydrolase CwlO-like protein